MGIWDDHGRLMRCVQDDPSTQGEKQLVDLWQRLDCSMEWVRGLRTFGEPGPFAALRMGQSFAQGLALGLGCALEIFSVFDVLPEDLMRQTRVYGGLSGSWISHTQEKTPSHLASDIFFIHPEISAALTVGLARLLCQKNSAAECKLPLWESGKGRADRYFP